jgi:multidrug efflux pump subunit AcrA (membrane-fusion protein)
VKWRAVALVAVVIGAAVPVALAPHWWEEAAVVDVGPVADRIITRAVVVAERGVARVAGPSEGRVLEVPVRVGDRVEAGAKLAEIETVTGGPPGREIITAPIAGVVLARRADPGDSVAVAAAGAAGALFEIADTSKSEVRAEVEERDAASVTTGLKVEITSPGGRQTLGSGIVVRIAGTIERRSIGAEDGRVRADGAVRSVWITWEGDGPRPALGQSLEAVIQLPESEPVTRLPRRAIVVRDGRTVVRARYLLWSRAMPVEVGADDGSLAEVRGVPAGTSVYLP